MIYNVVIIPASAVHCNFKPLQASLKTPWTILNFGGRLTAKFLTAHFVWSKFVRWLIHKADRHPLLFEVLLRRSSRALKIKMVMSYSVHSGYLTSTEFR